MRWSMHQLLDTPEGKARMAEGIVKLVGAVYELKTGRVRFLSEPRLDLSGGSLSIRLQPFRPE